MRLIVSLAIGAAAVIVSITDAIATKPDGVVSNVILAQGDSPGAIEERIQAGTDWKLTLETQGESEVFHQDLVVGPGGRTGWHRHPGLLLITVKEGAIDFYDKDCRKRTYTAGQSFTESAEPHNLFNRGRGNARLLAAYIVKKGEPRRTESEQPACATGLGLP
jgi:quercetin dioxygenase-like cupin family protein